MRDIYGSHVCDDLKAKDYILIGFTFSVDSQSFVYMRIIQNIEQYIYKTEAIICKTISHYYITCALLMSFGIDQGLVIGHGSFRDEGSCPILKHLDSCGCSKISQIFERRRIHS
jgi:hypothetical protein